METIKENLIPSYQKELVTLRDNLTSMIPTEKLNIFDSDANQLQKNLQDVLQVKVGDEAPNFALANANGNVISLDKLAEKGKTILVFYRGNWCPYCNLQLAQFQKVMPILNEYKTSLIAISPQKPDESLSMKEKNELEFEVLSDIGNIVARKYTKVFVNGETPVNTMVELGIDYDSFYADETRELPVPAVFIIDENKKVIFAKTEGGDYRNRTEINEIINQLKNN
jgi:peroxiredoxin